MRHLKRTWPIWVLLLGLIIFFTEIVFNTFYTIIGAWIAIIIIVIVMVTRASMALYKGR